MNVSPRQNPAYRLSLRVLRALGRSRWPLLLALYGALVAGLSHIQLQPAGGGVVFPGADKLFHAAEFAVFALLAWKAFRRRLAPALLATLVFAALDEFHQSFVPTRDASVLDGLADAVGAVLALVVARRSAVLWAFLRRRILSQTNSTRGI